MPRSPDCVSGSRNSPRALVKQFSRPDSEAPGRDLRLEGWANVLRHGQYNSVHCHPNAQWSLVYYVTGNDAPQDRPFSGRLELLDPRPGASLTYEDDSALYGRLLFNPRPGQVIAFPAWLQHQVHPHFGDGPAYLCGGEPSALRRLSVAF